MATFEGKVIGGRLIVDAPTDLPEGALVALVPVRVREAARSEPPPTEPLLSIDPFYAWAQGITMSAERGRGVAAATASARLLLPLLRSRYPEYDGPREAIDKAAAWLDDRCAERARDALGAAFRLGHPDRYESVVLASGEAMEPWASHACWAADHAAALTRS